MEYPEYIVKAIQAQHDALMEVAGLLANPESRKEAIAQMQALLDLSKRTTRTIGKFKQELAVDDKDKLAFMKSVLLDIKMIDDFDADDFRS